MNRCDHFRDQSGFKICVKSQHSNILAKETMHPQLSLSLSFSAKKHLRCKILCPCSAYFALVTKVPENARRQLGIANDEPSVGLSHEEVKLRKQTLETSLTAIALSFGASDDEELSS